MKEEENEQFFIEKSAVKGPIYMTNHHRINNLQNKVIFYEGQVEPLYDQTIFLKENIMTLSKMVISSTEILRDLLPTHNDPMKKLKLQMATIQEISKMIDEDWKNMQSQIQRLKKQFTQQQKEKAKWMQLYYDENRARNQQKQKYQAEVQQSKKKLQQEISNAKINIENLKQKGILQNSSLHEQINRAEKLLHSTIRQFNLFKHEQRLKDKDHEKQIFRLNKYIENSSKDFEETKKVIKQLCQNQMNEKLLQQADNYELMIKMRQNENFQLSIRIDQINEQTIKFRQEKDKEIERNYQKIHSLNKNNSDLMQAIEIRDQNLSQNHKQMKDMQFNIQNYLKEISQSLIKITQKENYIKQYTKSHEEMVQHYEQKVKYLKQNEEKSVSELIQQKQQLQKKINVFEQSIIQYKIIIAQEQQKIKEILQQKQLQWLQKQQKYNEEMKNYQNNLKMSESSCNRLKQQKERQLKRAKEQNQQILDRISKRNIDILQRKQKQVASKMKAAVENQEAQFLRYKACIKEQMQAQKQIYVQLNKQLIKKHKVQLEEVKLNKQQQMKVLINQKQQLMENLNVVDGKRLQIQQLAHQEKLNIMKKLKRIQQQAAQERSKLNEQLQAQMNDFQTQIFSRQKAMTDLQKNHEFELSLQQQNLKKIKENLLSEINLLKESSAIITIQKRYIQQIKELKKQFNDKFYDLQDRRRTQLKTLLDNHKEEVSQLKNRYQNQITNSFITYQRYLIQIIQTAEMKDRSNDRVEFGIVEGILQNCDSLLKKTYAIYQINKLHNKITQKQKIIDELNQNMSGIQARFEQILRQKRQQIDFELQIMKKQCYQKIQRLIIQCDNKVQLIETQRKRFSQKMYAEFSHMQETSEKRYKQLQKKYNQLQLVFEERPSRQEDVSKIKELAGIKERLNSQIVSFHKKIQTANEIVKYLNLELQNYKQTYDIFRPTAQISNFAQLFHNYNSNTAQIANKTLGFGINGLNVPIKQNGRSVSIQNSVLREETHKKIKLGNISKKKNDFSEINMIKGNNFLEEGSQQQVLQSKQTASKTRNLSYADKPIINKEKINREVINREKIKTQKGNVKQYQIFSYAQSFMKLIQENGTTNNKQKQSPQNDPKSFKRYRKKKLKTLNNTGIEHY